MKTQLKLVLGFIAVIIFISLGTYIRLWNLHFRIGPFFVHHWIALIGGGYLLIAIAIFAYLRRYTSIQPGRLLKIHVFGNLFAFMFISTHFAHHLGRPAAFAADLGTGLTAFLLLIFIVIAGLMLRFVTAHEHRGWWQMVHVGLSFSLLVIVGIHTLKNFGLL